MLPPDPEAVRNFVNQRHWLDKRNCFLTAKDGQLGSNATHIFASLLTTGDSQSYRLERSKSKANARPLSLFQGVHTVDVHQEYPISKGANVASHIIDAPALVASSRKYPADKPRKEREDKGQLPQLSTKDIKSPFDGLDVPDETSKRIINGALHLDVLRQWLRRGKGIFHLGLIWMGAEISNNFSAVGRKYCTPSQRCERWFCSCGRSVRAVHAQAALGALILREEQGILGPEAIFLPLVYCSGEDVNENTKYSSSKFESIDLRSSSTLVERWSIFTELVTQNKVICFNAHVILMPILRNICVLGKQPVPIFKSLFCVKLGAWILHTCDSHNSQLLDFPELWKRRRSATERPKFSVTPSHDSAGKCTKGLRKLFEDILSCSILAKDIIAELESTRMLTAAEEIEMPLAIVLSATEVIGIGVDKLQIEATKARLDAALKHLETAAHLAAGVEFNLSSAEQIAQLLYENLRLPSPCQPLRKIQKHPTTSVEVLTEIKDCHPVVPIILEHRKVSKLFTTFTQSLYGYAVPTSVDQGDDCTVYDRIHARWHQTAVETGRLSCSNPNLQQLPANNLLVGSVSSSLRPENNESDGGIINIRNFFLASRMSTTLIAVVSDWNI